MEVYVGADWSATELVCSTCSGDELTRSIQGAERTFASVRDLVDRVRQRHAEAGQVHVVIEAGAPGWVEMLHHAGAVVHVVDPKKAKAFASSVCSSGAKDDRRDGAMLAEMGRSSHLRLDVWTPDSDLGEQLGELSAMHETLTKDLTAAQQRLRGHLRERMPALEAVLGDLTRRWVHRLLRAVPTAWHAQKMTEEGFATLMRGSGARTISLAEVAQALHACTAPWLTEAVAGAQATRVTMLVEQIELLVRQLGDYDNDRYVAALKANGVAWAAELERTAA